MKKLICFYLMIITILSGVVPISAESTLTPVANLPTIFITLDNAMAVESITKEVQSPATFSMVGEGIANVTDLPITIKGRGNSTWKLPKKPYQIKFETKTDLLGMGKSKKWILLANYWDKTHLRNAMMYHLANQMNSGFSVECRFVDVVMNGEYQGCYLLCEKIEFGGNRIDEETDLGAVLMELEQQYRHATEGCDACVITNNGVHVTLKEPEVDETFSAEDFATTKELTLSRLNAIENALNQGYEVYSKLIDVDSFVDWYIQNELAKNYDAAFVTSSYCYLDKEGILHMGPVWDVDVCFGNQDVVYPNSTDNGLNHYNYRADKGMWYLQLFADTTFGQLVKQRWTSLINAGTIEGMFQDIDKMVEEIAPSKALDQARWPAAMKITDVRDQGKGAGGVAYFTFEEEVAYLKNWLQKRIAFLNSQWNDQAFATTPYRTLATLQGGEIAPGNFGSVTDGVWKWYRQGNINKVMKTTKPFWQEILQPKRYLVTVTFSTGLSKTQDILGLQLLGIDPDGTTHCLDATIATHVTYSVAQKDREGFAKLFFPIDLTGTSYSSYALVAEAHSATGLIKTITLEEETAPTLGDVNADGDITAKDALLVLQHTVGKITLSPAAKIAAQVDKSTEINAKDALEILKFTVGKINQFPIETEA